MSTAVLIPARDRADSNFDRIAPFYRAIETFAFGNALQRARVAFLSQTQGCRRALIVGEGNGRFLVELLRANQTIEVDCIDASVEMLRVARNRTRTYVSPIPAEGSRRSYLKEFAGGLKAWPRQRCRLRCSLGVAQDDGSSRLQFHLADIREWEPDRPDYDLIVTHFFLDCFDRAQLPRVIEKIVAASAPKARWLISDFVIPSHGPRRIQAKIWSRAMYAFFGRVANLKTRDLVDPSPIFRDFGFELHRRINTRFELVSSQLWQR